MEIYSVLVGFMDENNTCSLSR